jgi:hypothetical protein
MRDIEINIGDAASAYTAAAGLANRLFSNNPQGDLLGLLILVAIELRKANERLELIERLLRP